MPPPATGLGGPAHAAPFPEGAPTGAQACEGLWFPWLDCFTGRGGRRWPVLRILFKLMGYMLLTAAAACAVVAMLLVCVFKWFTIGRHVEVPAGTDRPWLFRAQVFFRPLRPVTDWLSRLGRQ